MSNNTTMERIGSIGIVFMIIGVLLTLIIGPELIWSLCVPGGFFLCIIACALPSSKYNGALDDRLLRLRQRQAILLAIGAVIFVASAGLIRF